MSKTPLFSVIIPAFNAEAFVGEAIHSVLDQSEPDLELIVVDDGSTDHTAAVANSFDDPRIKVVSVPPSGLPAVPRNLGVQFSRGGLIAFLDADDSWPRNKLSAFRNAIERHPTAGLFFSNGFITDSAGGLRQRILSQSKYLERIEPRDELLVLLNYIPLSSVVVRRDVLTLGTSSGKGPARQGADFLPRSTSAGSVRGHSPARQGGDSLPRSASAGSVRGYNPARQGGDSPPRSASVRPRNPDRKGGDPLKQCDPNQKDLSKAQDSNTVDISTLKRGPFEERPELRAVEDYLLWLQLNIRTPFHYLPEPLLYKRMHAANISADRSLQLRRIHKLLDRVEELDAYDGDLVRLARSLYDARYQPTARHRLTAFLEVSAALVSHPVKTTRRLASVIDLASSRKRNFNGIGRPGVEPQPIAS